MSASGGTGRLGAAEAAVAAWGIGTCEHDHASGRVRGSPRFFELHGLPGRSSASADELWDRVHPADRAGCEARVARAHAEGADGRVDLVCRVRQVDGSFRWLRYRAETSFRRMEGGRRPEITRGSALDVSESRAVEAALRRTRDRLEEALRASRVGIFEHDHVRDPGALDLYWSARQREIFGVGADEPATLAGFLAGVHPDDLDAIRRAVSRAHDPDGDGYYDVEHRFLHPDGNVRWLLTRSSTHFGEIDGRRVPVRTVGAVLDVTERKHFEQALEQRAALLDATPDFVAIARPAGELVYLNRAGRRLLGIGDDDDVSGRDLLSAHPPATAERLRAEGLPTADRTGSWSGETDFLRPDGTLVPTSQVLVSHYGSDGRVAFHSTIARDVSHERQLEDQVRQAQKMEAIGRLAGGVAHDFNNILSVILGFGELASAEIGPDGRGRAAVQGVVEAAQRAASLTSQLLAFSRRQVLRPRVVDVGEVVNRLGPMIERLVGEDVVVRLVTGAGPARVKADPSQVEQILLNLVVNARDAMPAGGHIAIETRLVHVDETDAASRLDLSAGPHVAITVSDDGAGMDAETCSRIFEPFFTTKGSGRGTGLGRATVFGIVRQSGGAISVYSEPGHGTTFKVYFPSSDEPLSAVASSPATTRSERGGAILVAEDDAQLRAVMVEALERAGYRVVGAAGPLEVLSIAREHAGPIDLLLTDVVMPQMNGKQLANRLLEVRPELSVLYMSGYAEGSIVHHGVLEEGVHFLAKPITPTAVVGAIDRVLDAAARRGPRRRQ